MGEDALRDLATDVHGRVERRHRVLGDERDLVAPDPLHLLLVERRQVPTEELDRARGDPAVGRKEPHDREADGALAAPRLADHADAFPRADGEGNAVDGADGSVAPPELGVEIVDLEDGFHPLDTTSEKGK